VGAVSEYKTAPKRPPGTSDAASMPLCTLARPWIAGMMQLSRLPLQVVSSRSRLRPVFDVIALSPWLSSPPNSPRARSRASRHRLFTCPSVGDGPLQLQIIPVTCRRLGPRAVLFHSNRFESLPCIWHHKATRGGIVPWLVEEAGDECENRQLKSEVKKKWFFVTSAFDGKLKVRPCFQVS